MRRRALEAQRQVQSRHAAQHLERLAVAAQRVLVEQSRHDLVERVEGRPDALAREEPVEEALGERREVPVAQSRLAGGEPFDRSPAARRQRGVAGPRRDESAGREVVPGEVAAQLVLRRLPATERRGAVGRPAFRRKVWSRRSVSRLAR